LRGAIQEQIGQEIVRVFPVQDAVPRLIQQDQDEAVQMAQEVRTAELYQAQVVQRRVGSREGPLAQNSQISQELRIYRVLYNGLSVTQVETSIQAVRSGDSTSRPFQAFGSQVGTPRRRVLGKQERDVQGSFQQ
jgi:hypothetical protein